MADVIRPLLDTAKLNVSELEVALYGKAQVNIAALHRTTDEAIKALRAIQKAFGLV